MSYRWAIGLTISIGLTGLVSTARAEPKLFSPETLELMGAKLQQIGRHGSLSRDGARLWNAIRTERPRLTERKWPDMPKEHVFKNDHEFIRAGRYGRGKQLQMEFKGANGRKRLVMNFGGGFVDRSMAYDWNNGKGLWKLETAERGVEYFSHDTGKSPVQITRRQARRILRKNGRIKRAVPASKTWRAITQTNLRLKRLLPRLMASTLAHRVRYGKSAVDFTPPLYRKK